MPVWLRDVYVEELPALIAERQLLAIEAANVPYLEADDGEKVISRLQDIAATGHSAVSEETNKPSLSQEMYKAHMAAAGIPIYFTDPVEEEEVK